MRRIFEEHGVEVVAISKDDVEDVRRHRKRDGLSFTMLSDPKMKVHHAYGLVHKNGMQYFTFYVFGVPLGWPTCFRSMAIPTTFLVDEEGVVRWIDQTDDYRMRGDTEKIESALATLAYDIV